MDKTHSQAQVGSSVTPCCTADKSSGLMKQAECECMNNAVNPLDSPLSMPICFLVREQAKSLITIQDLQKRLENIEGFQCEVISAIGEVHNYLSQNVKEGALTHSSGSAIKNKSTVIQERPYFLSTLKENELQLSHRKTHSVWKKDLLCSMPATTKEEQSAWRLNYCRPKNEIDISEKKIFDLNKTKDCVSESDKQDSGLDSDCRDQGQESSISQSTVFSPRKHCSDLVSSESSDELLELLNEIGRKGEALQKYIAEVEERNATASSQIDEKPKIQNEQEEFNHILNEVREQVDIRNKLRQSENGQLERVATSKECKGEGLQCNLVKQHPHGYCLHKSDIGSRTYQRDGEIAASNCRMQRDIVEIPNEKLVHKVNSAKVSSILKENSVLELRKQVLLYLMENEILHSKLSQTEQLLGTKTEEWQKAEAFLNIEVKNLMQENKNLHITLEEQKLEIIALKSKVRMLERVLQAVTVENRELNLQLGETLGFGEALQCNGLPMKKLSSNISVSHSEVSKPRRSSLPAKLCSQQESSLPAGKSQTVQNSKSSVDVTACGQQCVYEIIERYPTIQKVNMVNQTCHQSVLSSNQAHLSSPNPLIQRSSPSHAISRHSDCLDELIKRTLNSELASAKSHESQWKEKEPNGSKTYAAYNEHNINESSFKTSIKCTSSDKNCKPIEPIKGKPRSTDVSKFPFYSILEKLKPSAEHKLRKNLRPELCQISESNTAADQAPKYTPLSHSNQKVSECRYNRNQVKTSSSAESDQSLVEQCKKMYPGLDKKLHKRVQDFLDRITAESDEAMV